MIRHQKTCQITSQNKNVPTDDTNIVAKIFNSPLLQFDTGLLVHIEKKIPMGGGLGGGSANAAGFLWACNQLFNWQYSRQQLIKIGSHFGSDIPFFFLGPENEEEVEWIY